MSSLLHAALPAPFDWLRLGFVAGPLGLFLIGVGATALRLTEEPGPDSES